MGEPRREGEALHPQLLALGAAVGAAAATAADPDAAAAPPPPPAVATVARARVAARGRASRSGTRTRSACCGASGEARGARQVAGKEREAGLSVADQVEMVVRHATSADNLAQLYEGWVAWV